MTVNVTLRGVKGSALSHAEVDNNFSSLKQEFDNLSAVNGTTLVGGVEAGKLAKLAPDAVTPEMYGAVGDITTDDTTAISNWMNSGKPLVLTRLATYRLTSEINLPANPIIIMGLGRFPVYPYEFSWYNQPSKLPTFLIDHDGSDAFRFKQNKSARGSYLSGFNVVKVANKLCIRAFGFDVSGVVTSGANYGYDCTFHRVGIFDFTSAFDMYIGSTSIEPTMADITVNDCCINRNGWIMRNLNGTAWNMLRFTNNKAGQQTIGGLDVSAHSFIENGNLLEGMPNPVKVTGAYEGCNVGGSYFEANTGIALYNLQSLRGPSIVNPCTILANSTTTVVRGSNISELTSYHPVVVEASYNLVAPNLDGSVNGMSEIDPLSLGVSLCSQFSDIMLKRPRLLKTSTNYIATSNQSRSVSPHNSNAMVVENLNTLASLATSKTINISAIAYDYVVITLMLKHKGVQSASTYITVDINGVSATGSRDYSFGDEDLHISKGDWKVYTLVVKPQVDVSSIALRMYPYGVGAAANIPFELSGITAYSVASINNVKPYIDENSLNAVMTAPTSGTWVVADSFKNLNVSSMNESKFVYTSTGWVYG